MAYDKSYRADFTSMGKIQQIHGCAVARSTIFLHYRNSIQIQCHMFPTHEMFANAVCVIYTVGGGDFSCHVSI
jgi:hypothetical protein